MSLQNPLGRTKEFVQYRGLSVSFTTKHFLRLRFVKSKLLSHPLSTYHSTDPHLERTQENESQQIYLHNSKIGNCFLVIAI
jgi:hypothetical protein